MSPAGRPKGTATGRRPRVNITLDDKHLAFYKRHGGGNVSRGVRAVADAALEQEAERTAFKATGSAKPGRTTGGSDFAVERVDK